MSIDNLQILAKHCIGTAESEDSAGFLEDIFFDTGILTDVFDILPGSPRLLVGHKGTGKTVIFKQISKILEREGVDVLYLVPAEITGTSTPTAEENSALQAFYYESLVKQVAIKLGSKMSGLLGENQAILLRQAIVSGTKDPDVVEKAADFLSKVGKIFTEYDLTTMLEYDREIPVQKLFRSITNNLSTSKIFFLIIDEPDDVMVDGEGISRLWALLNACKMFSQKLPNIRCLISLRTEIWNLLKENSAGRKNIDHFEPLILSLDPPDKDIHEILCKRLLFVANVCKEDTTKPFAAFFEGDSATLPLPARDAQSYWWDYLEKQSRNRPRDILQHIKYLAENARKNQRQKINSQDVQDCAIFFSESRVNSIADDYAVDFPDLRNVINRFSSLHGFEFATEQVLKFLRATLSELPRNVRGKRLVAASETDVYSLLRMLHEIGFLNPCVPDDRESRGYRHIMFSNDKNFVSQSNLNTMLKVSWEIHPIYRSYLYSLTDNEIHRQAIISKRKREKITDHAFKKKRR